MKIIETTSGLLFAASVDDVEALIETGEKHFDFIWNLAEELSDMEEREKTIAGHVLLGRLKDYKAPSGVRQENLFLSQARHCAQALQNGCKVLVHCWGGRGRTSLGVATIKMMLDSMTAKDALAFTKLHLNGPENVVQKNFIRGIRL
jgi:protein tyrosine phosphatase